MFYGNGWIQLIKLNWNLLTNSSSELERFRMLFSITLIIFKIKKLVTKGNDVLMRWLG